MARIDRRGWIFIVLGGVLLATLFLSVFIGRYPQPYWMPMRLLGEDQLARQLVLSLRLPRLCLGLLLGVTLAATGTVMQMIFRNPLVEPGFLGVSQGATFGAALSILWIGSTWSMHALAILFAMTGLFASYFLALRIRFGGWILRLVLAGIVISALFSAGTGILKTMADPLTQLPEITFWLLGGLWSTTWKDVRYVLPFVIPGLTLIFLLRWRLNLLSLDDETAWSLGAAPIRERTLLLFGGVAATASLTSVTGIVGWIGLIIPHLSRRIFGADSRYNLPGSMLLGGIFAVVCDDIARSLMAGEIPLGILTSLIGAVSFIALMITIKRKPGHE
jgi:iron complex transport system permease protein